MIDEEVFLRWTTDEEATMIDEEVFPTTIDATIIEEEEEVISSHIRVTTIETATTEVRPASIIANLLVTIADPNEVRLKLVLASLR